MKIKTAFVAAVIGFATVAGATAASAAPLGAPAIAAQGTVVEAGYGHRHGHGYGHGYHGRHHYKKHHAYYGKKCYKKRFKVWSHHHHGWVYKFKTVCHRGGYGY